MYIIIGLMTQGAISGGGSGSHVEGHDQTVHQSYIRMYWEG